jgi:hypothetical protein
MVAASHGYTPFDGTGGRKHHEGREGFHVQHDARAAGRIEYGFDVGEEGFGVAFEKMLGELDALRVGGDSAHAPGAWRLPRLGRYLQQRLKVSPMTSVRFFARVQEAERVAAPPYEVKNGVGAV